MMMRVKRMMFSGERWISRGRGASTQDAIYANMPVIDTDPSNPINNAMMIDKHRYLIHYRDPLLVCNEDRIEHAWRIPGACCLHKDALEQWNVVCTQ